MPQIGDIKTGKELGRVTEFHKFIWYACEECGKERWVAYSRNGIRAEFCQQCGCKPEHRRQYRGGNPHKWTDARKESYQMQTNPRWKGGRIYNYGYILVKLSKDDPFYSMCRKKGYVLEHRLVMAKKLGRCLLKSEQVHHRPDVPKDDNREEVLYLMPNSSDHSRLIPCSNCELKKEIRLLRFELKQMREDLQGKLV